MEQTIQLTEYQLQLIKLNRQKQQIYKKQLQLKRIEQYQKQIEQRERTILTDKEFDIRQIKAANEYVSKFPSDWKVEIIQTLQTYQVFGEYLNIEHPEEQHYKREILWSREEPRQRASIANDKYIITVKQHIVYGGSFRGSKSNKGFKLYLPTEMNKKYIQKAYTHPATILKKIKEYEDNISFVHKTNVARRKNLESNMSKLLQLFPTATIVAYNAYDNIYKNTVKQIDVLLKNKFNIRYRISQNGKLLRQYIKFSDYTLKIDQFKLLQLFNNINTQEMVCQTQN